MGLSEEPVVVSLQRPRPTVELRSVHMDQALPKKLWDQLGLVSILDTINRLSLCLSQDSVKNLFFCAQPHSF